jgi:DNA recombination protein RmuC
MYIDEFYLDFLLGFFSSLLFIGIFFGFIYRKKEKEYDRVLKHSKKQQEYIYNLKLEITTYKERLDQINSLKQNISNEFQNIANSVLNESTKTNSQHIKMAIQPFYENLEFFNNQIKEFYFDESKQRYSLEVEIQKLNNLNKKISQDAINLTNALKGENKIQGDWGELILGRVLDSSGLVKGREYSIQKEYKTEDSKRYRPDVIIHLPESREVIIDSKVSLKSYELYFNDELNKKQHLSDFIRSIKTHISELSKKEYQNIDGIKSLDFVLMFIPIEGAFATALGTEESLYEYAYSKNVILTSPTTLISVLRVIENSWRVTYQNKNAKIIAKKAGELSGKFKLFIDEMKKIDSSLVKAKDAYEEAFKRLSSGKGNLIARSDELNSLQKGDYLKDDNSLSTF